MEIIILWLNHCFVQMCSFIVWNCFSGERCGLRASCYSLQVRWLEYVYEREDKTGASLILWWRTSLYSWSIVSTRQINWCCAVSVATLSEWWNWYIVNIILIKKWLFWLSDFFRYEFFACFNFHSLNKFPSLVNLAEGMVVGDDSISISNMKVGTVLCVTILKWVGTCMYKLHPTFYLYYDQFSQINIKFVLFFFVSVKVYSTYM